MSIQSSAIGAMAALLGLAVPALAASSADIAASLAPEVVQVVSGGNWEDGGKKGGYRAVLVAPSGAEANSTQLYLEWLAAGKDGAPPVLVMSSPIKEINDLKLANATLSMEYEKANEFTVFVEPSDPNRDAGNSYTILATAPGKYTFSLGAPPE